MLNWTRGKVTYAALGAALGMFLVSACGQTTAQSSQGGDSPEARLVKSAQIACLRYRDRAEHDPDEFSEFLAQSCTNVLSDIEQSDAMDEERHDLAIAYLEALVTLENETTEMVQRRKAARIYPLRPNRAGEFLMAHHLGVIDNYGYWRHAYLRANPT